MATSKREVGNARNLDSPVQDAVAKVAQDPKLSYDQVAQKVRQMVKGASTSAKSVASLVLRLRKQGVKVPARARPQAQEQTRAHA
jgi:hypothetical protein